MRSRCTILACNLPRASNVGEIIVNLKYSWCFIDYSCRPGSGLLRDSLWNFQLSFRLQGGGEHPRILATDAAGSRPVTDDYEIIFALDPSPDRTEEVILAHRAEDAHVKLLKFSRRFGQPMATLAGLQYSSGDAVIVMDVDLQDPPELVQKMVAKWRRVTT